MAAAPPRLVILVEHLYPLARIVAPAIAQDGRLKARALLRFLTRAEKVNASPVRPDQARCELFGLPDSRPPPVAALTHADQESVQEAAGGFWVRLDPVTLRADRMRVFIMGEGLQGFAADERGAVLGCIAAVLREEGMEPHTAADHIRVRLATALPFDFTPLDEAMGMDMGDALPAHTEARSWRRICNELQVALHHLDINKKRRGEGRQEINGAWAWGGGELPQAQGQGPFCKVFSSHPVSRGLARLHQQEPEDENSLIDGAFPTVAGDCFLDWTAQSADALQEWKRLEALTQWVLENVSRGALSAELCDTKGQRWLLSQRQARRFWRREKPLEKLLELETS